MANFDRWHFANNPLNKEVDVRNDDEGRSQTWPKMVSDDQVVALKLPVDIAVCLHFREGVAVVTDRGELIGTSQH